VISLRRTEGEIAARFFHAARRDFSAAMRSATRRFTDKRGRHGLAKKFPQICHAPVRLDSYAAFKPVSRVGKVIGRERVRWRAHRRRCIGIRMVGTAQGRLRPPCDSVTTALLRMRIMSEQDYEGVMETLHLLKSPANAARLQGCGSQQAEKARTRRAREAPVGRNRFYCAAWSRREGSW
jgi:hypothetical protein